MATAGGDSDGVGDDDDGDGVDTLDYVWNRSTWCRSVAAVVSLAAAAAVAGVLAGGASGGVRGGGHEDLRGDWDPPWAVEGEDLLGSSDFSPSSSPFSYADALGFGCQDEGGREDHMLLLHGRDEGGRGGGGPVPAVSAELRVAGMRDRLWVRAHVWASPRSVADVRNTDVALNGGVGDGLEHAGVRVVVIHAAREDGAEEGHLGAQSSPESCRQPPTDGAAWEQASCPLPEAA